MKKSVFFLLVMVFTLESYSRDTTTQKTRITDVAVFFSGAQVTRKADLKIKKGKHLLLIDKLPQEIDPLSIQTSAIANCKILSVKHVLHTQGEGRKDQAEKAILDEIEQKQQRIKEIRNELGVFELEEKLLDDNRIIGSDNKGPSVAAIKEAADFYRARLNEIGKSKLNLNKELKKIDEDIQALYEKLNVLTVEKRKTYSQVYITIDCEKDLPGDFSLKYYVSSAGWEPLYDFRVEDITTPFNIVYNANVFQSTGEDWSNVKISLSSGNPSLSGERQRLIPWYLEQRNPYPKATDRFNAGAIKGTLKDKNTGETIPFAKAAVFQAGRQIGCATTDIDGEFVIKPVLPGSYEVRCNYVGYNSQVVQNVIVNESKTTYVTISLAPAYGTNLERVDIVAYQVPLIDADMKSGATITREDYKNLATKEINSVYASSAGTYHDMPSGEIYSRQVAEEIETIYSAGNAVKSGVAGQEYLIEEPYTIPSDGSDYSIKIKEVSTQVTYLYHAIPKLESDVFLTAEITDWADLNLLPGKSSIYFKNTYVGQSYLDVAQTGDTLSVSLGRDNDVIVNRQGDKLVNDKKVNGSTIKETMGWTTIVRNNKNAPIRLILEDQYPLSSRKSVEVYLLQSPGAKVEERSGKISWDMTIASNEKKTTSFKYSVKYPKWSRVIAE